MNNLTERDMQFCQSKEKEYLVMREYYLAVYEYSRARIPDVEYQTRYSSHYKSINPNWYLQQIQGLSQQFAVDLGWYFQETYCFPLRMNFTGSLIPLASHPKTVQPPVSWRDIITIIVERIENEDFLAFGIQHIRTTFLDTVLPINPNWKGHPVTVHKNIVSIPDFTWPRSFELLIHVLSLFETGHPALAAKYRELPQMDREEHCGDWHLLYGDNRKVIAVKAYKNHKVQVKFVSAVEAEMFYHQFCVRE